MTESGLCFSMVAVPAGSGAAWSERARAAEQAGWTNLLVPDTVWTPSPFPALAAAAAVTSTLRMRTWVIAAPLRSPAAVVRETQALQTLSDGRFDLGVGAGRPDADQDAERLGVPWGTGRQRIAQAAAVITAVREQVQPAPGIVVAAVGPRMLAATAPLADRIALPLPPAAVEGDLAAAVDRTRSAAGRPVVLIQQMVGLAGRLPAWLQRSGLDPVQLAAGRAVGMLTGDAAEMADTLLERQATHGIDEFVVPADLAEPFEPVIARLTR